MSISYYKFKKRFKPLRQRKRANFRSLNLQTRISSVGKQEASMECDVIKASIPSEMTLDYRLQSDDAEKDDPSTAVDGTQDCYSSKPR